MLSRKNKSAATPDNGTKTAFQIFNRFNVLHGLVEEIVTGENRSQKGLDFCESIKNHQPSPALPLLRQNPVVILWHGQSVTSSVFSRYYR